MLSSYATKIILLLGDETKPTPPPMPGNALLQETGGPLLLEKGGAILLEAAS